jgi:RNA polymerase sigma-70 factor, ECF subfamily
METLRQVAASSKSRPSPVLVGHKDYSSAIRNEAQLIESVLSGDTSLYSDLVRPYETLVYRTAFMMLRNEADAEDAAQEAFLQAYCKLASCRSESTFSTWLITIVLNEARARLRRREGGLAVSLDSLSNQSTLLPAQYLSYKQESALQRVERAELRSQLQRAISDLPATYREVLLMRFLDELSVRETAQAPMSTDGLVKVCLHRARRMLQRWFRARGLNEKTFLPG